MVKPNNIAAISLLTATWVSASTTNSAFHRQNAAPMINANFPDPSQIRAEDGTWYAFATNNLGVAYVQMALALAATGPWTVLQQDALPTVGDVVQWNRNLGTRCSASRRRYLCTLLRRQPFWAKSNPLHGYCTSPDLEEHFTPAATPFACNIGRGGSIDPSGFIDVDGRYYITYKIDSKLARARWFLL